MYFRVVSLLLPIEMFRIYSCVINKVFKFNAASFEVFARLPVDF